MTHLVAGRFWALVFLLGVPLGIFWIYHIAKYAKHEIRRGMMLPPDWVGCIFFSIVALGICLTSLYWFIVAISGQMS